MTAETMDRRDDMSDSNEEPGREPTGRRVRRDLDGSPGRGGRLGGDDARTIPRPADEELVYRVDDKDEVVGAGRSTFDVLATIAGALAALGTFLLLSSLLGAAAGTIGYQTGVEGRDLSVGGLIGGLVVLFLSCLVGGWVAGRIARHRGALHGLVSPLWLLLLAGLLALLAAIFGDDLDVTDDVGLPDWFSRDALTTGAIITGLLALGLMLLGGWLGGKLAERHRERSSVAVVETRRAVRERPGGIVRGRSER
jgi:hypothetical protein